MKTLKMYLALIVATSALLLASCGTSSMPSFTSIGTTSASSSTTKSKPTPNATVRRGMSRDQVVQIMGQPHRKMTHNNRETWMYTGGNKGEMFARGFASNFVPVVGPLVAFAGAEVKNNTTTITFTGSRVTSIDSMSTSAPVIKGAFAGF